MLEVEDFIPIDIPKLIKRWEKIYNISHLPSTLSIDIQRDCRTINDVECPHTLRLFLLNNLPYSIIKILKEKQNDNS